MHRVQVLQALVDLGAGFFESVLVVGGEAERLVLQLVELALATSVDIRLALLQQHIVLLLGHFVNEDNLIARVLEGLLVVI